MLPSILNYSVYHEKKWKQRVSIITLYLQLKRWAFLFKYSFIYPVTRVNFLAANYFVYPSKRLNFNVSISKEKRLVKALDSFSP